MRITKYQTRHTSHAYYFTAEKSLSFSSDVMRLFQASGISQQPDHWRLYIDSSTKSLNDVLLHNGNQHSPIPVGHTEDCNNVAVFYVYTELLLKVNYDYYKWDVCRDFKMLGFLLVLVGQQRHCKSLSLKRMN